MRRLFTFLLLLPGISGHCWAQDLSGTWEGQIDADYMKLVLIKQGDTYIGYTYDEGMGYCKTNFLGDYNNSTRLLKGAGQSFIARTTNHVMCSYKLTYSKQDNGKYLVGTAVTKSAFMQILSMGMAARTVLKQVSTNVDTTVYMFSWLQQHGIQTNTIAQNKKVEAVKTDSLPAPPILSPAALTKKAFDDSIKTVKSQRTADTLSTIITAADSIIITIADNEVVDAIPSLFFTMIRCWCQNCLFRAIRTGSQCP